MTVTPRIRLYKRQTNHFHLTVPILILSLSCPHLFSSHSQSLYLVSAVCPSVSGPGFLRTIRQGILREQFSKFQVRRDPFYNLLYTILTTSF